MKASPWREFLKKNRRLIVVLVAAAAATAGVPVYLANPAVVDQVWQGIENAQPDTGSETL